MGDLILVLGGARSGKSRHAQQLAQELASDSDKVLFVATAEAKDEEMKARIRSHRRDRPSSWRTLEAPRRVAQAISPAIKDARVVLLDCMTLLVSNVMLGQRESPDQSTVEESIQAEIDALLQLCRDQDTKFIVVSNEVGMGLIPTNTLGRQYRDLLGRVNQTLASHARQVYCMVAGIPVELKALQSLFDSVTH